MSVKPVPASTDWRYKLIELNARLRVMRSRLVEAETSLADRLAELNAFEFKLRTVTAHLLQRLEKLDREINRLRQQLQDLDNGLRFSDEDYSDEFGDQFADFNVRQGEEAGSAEDFRYREQTLRKQPRPDLSPRVEADLKQLYRQLARRFHPDLGRTPEEREERTQLMMRINAAYHAGDLAALQQLDTLPDPDSHFATESDEREVEKLTRELGRCRTRLAEIHEQLSRLDHHKSAQLLRRYQKSQKNGRDFLAEIVVDIRSALSRRTAERDHLKDQLQNYDKFEDGEDRLADTILYMGLELGLDDDDTSPDSSWHTYDEDDE